MDQNGENWTDMKEEIDALVTNWTYRERKKSGMVSRYLTRATGVHWSSGLGSKLIPELTTETLSLKRIPH